MHPTQPNMRSLDLSRNTRALLMHLLQHETTYRSHLAVEMGVSATTITNLVDDLLEIGIVEEAGLYDPDGERRVGRPRSSIRLVPDSLYVVGVHLGAWAYRIAVTNLKAEPVHHIHKQSQPDIPADVFLEQVAKEIECVIEESNIPRDRILGLGVGAAGLIDSANGVVKLFPNLGWQDVPIQAYLEEQVGLPVVVDNNVRAMALSEAFFGIGRGAHSLVFIFSRAGVGAGIVVNHRMLASSSVSSAELGHSIIMAEGGKQCRCGNHGCLETLFSETILNELAFEIARDDPGGTIATRLEHEPDQRPVLHLFDAAREGNKRALNEINQTGRYLGYAISNLVNIINPEMIILGGTLYDGFDLFFPVIQSTLQDTAFAGLGSNVKLTATQFGSEVGVIGSATLALANFLYLHPEEI